MANPTNRASRTRKRLRRANWKAKAPQISTCPQCHEPKLPHVVCKSCGYYKGREVIAKVD
ncbi:MAG TPA: 50S ribosomal protein L32 [Bacillota bacterium]|jgi:large subunit ribosomal protein L32|nr:50S ribosomal protein L32 [Bacillota bacterium]HOL09870.1 50S ribosomal protein L32 [Bacillota bacterium]HPO97570.1 50S ribosomal protein L32 [Bacillota bacterium]